VTRLVARLGELANAMPAHVLCDACTADGQRIGDELQGISDETVLGAWPDNLETDAAVRLALSVGPDSTWESLVAKPPVAQKLAERAQLQTLDLEISRHLQHLQHVCHSPRLHLRVEEERLPVSRARRTPLRAVADLLSHPGDWEHRTLWSIRPARVLARMIEDEWDLYENRVAVRLVGNLLAYLAERLEELRTIEEALLTGHDHSDKARTSFWRVRRVMTLWADTLTTKTENELRTTMRTLERAQRDLQSLLGSPLYGRVPTRASVPLSLKPTNILVSDLHYRKVAALWRAWVKYGHRRQETHQQRAERRQREARAWDRFVLHLVVRSLAGLGWAAEGKAHSWKLLRPGWKYLQVEVDAQGVVTIRSGDAVLRLLPLCAQFGGSDASNVLKALRAWDTPGGEVVAVHVRPHADLIELDRASGWSFAGRGVLFGCSPWGIDSEERMARLLNGWINRAAIGRYPFRELIRALPEIPSEWGWLRYDGSHLVALRAPVGMEAETARAWAARKASEHAAESQRKERARQAFSAAPREAISAFNRFLPEAKNVLESLDECPVCGGVGDIDTRPGKQADGSDATWWAICTGCKSEWGLRQCVECSSRFRALLPHVGFDLRMAAASTPPIDWPDKVLGRDAWAQLCGSGRSLGQFRCPDCGFCPGGGCGRCQAPASRA